MGYIVRLTDSCVFRKAEKCHVPVSAASSIVEEIGSVIRLSCRSERKQNPKQKHDHKQMNLLPRLPLSTKQRSTLKGIIWVHNISNYANRSHLHFRKFMAVFKGSCTIWLIIQMAMNQLTYYRCTHIYITHRKRINQDPTRQSEVFCLLNEPSLNAH